MNKEERKIYEIEKYLDYIESIEEVSPEWHFKKKLASALKLETAYNLLRNYNKTSTTTDKIVISLHKYVELTEPEKDIIMQQARAVFDKISLSFKEQERFLVREIKFIMPIE